MWPKILVAARLPEFLLRVGWQSVMARKKKASGGKQKKAGAKANAVGSEKKQNSVSAQLNKNKKTAGKHGAKANAVGPEKKTAEKKTVAPSPPEKTPESPAATKDVTKPVAPPATPTNGAKNDAPKNDTSPPPKKKTKKNPSKNANTSTNPNPSGVRPRLRRKTKAKLQTGGAQNCINCKQICTYGHKCVTCKRTFHVTCMLSLHKGATQQCIECFEKSSQTLKTLDSYMHDPYSPGCFIPYHPFTKRYACARLKLNLNVVPDILA